MPRPMLPGRTHAFKNDFERHSRAFAVWVAAQMPAAPEKAANPRFFLNRGDTP
jgi:hypothetical protein